MTPMIIRPNPLLLDSIRGPVGGVVFQRLRSQHIARRRWTIRAPATAAQTTHRQAVARAASLFASVKADVLPAWLLYADALGYGAFAAWQHLNILPAKAATVGAITPPNAAYTPIAAPDWEPGGLGQIDATWTYAGPAATVFVSTYYRKTNTFAWTHCETVDATAEAATISGLLPAATYEVALVPHTAAKLTFGQAYHELLAAGTALPEDFDTYEELDPQARITPNGTLVTVVNLRRDADARLWFDKGVDYFGPAFTHTFRLDFDAIDDNGAADCWAVSNTVDDAQQWLNDNAEACTLELWRGGANRRLNLKSLENESESFYDDYASGATYYVAIQRTSETALEARVYNDEAMLDLKHKHEVVIPTGRRYRYVFAVNSVCIAGSDNASFRVRNLILLDE